MSAIIITIAIVSSFHKMNGMNYLFMTRRFYDFSIKIILQAGSTRGKAVKSSLRPVCLPLNRDAALAVARAVGACIDYFASYKTATRWA